MKILLNDLPPSMIEIPSAGSSVLKGFLQDNGVETEIVYWNILLHDVLSKYKPTSDTTLAPFMFFLAEEANDDTARRHLLSYVQKAIPFYKFVANGNYEELVHSWQESIIDLFVSKLGEMALDKIALLGISAKHYGWIPGIILAKCAKQLHPDIKIVIGGVSDNISARALLRLSERFDFAIWGEGEYPLLSLYTQATSGHPEFAHVPNLAFRQNGEIVSTDIETVACPDLNKIYHGKYDDFFVYASGIDSQKITLPVEGSRGCFWSRCKFCLMNTGYQSRRRPNRVIIEEIKSLVARHQVYQYRFSDHSANGGLSDFVDLLGELVQLSQDYGHNLKFSAEITPVNMNAQVIKMMADAGFKSVQIGFEGLSDTILHKFNKAHRLADNLLFVKWALEYGIKVSASNIITAYPDETEQDIVESENNIHYFRFYLNKAGYRLAFVRFALGMNAAYFGEVKDVEDYVYSPIDYYLPEGFIQAEDKFSLLSYTKSTRYGHLWDHLAAVHQYYLDNRTIYKLIQNDRGLHFLEYVNGEEVKRVDFDRPEYYDILEMLNRSVYSFDKLCDRLREKYGELNRDDIRGLVSVLQSHYLVYAARDMRSLVSVVNMDYLIRE